LTSCNDLVRIGPGVFFDVFGIQKRFDGCCGLEKSCIIILIEIGFKAELCGSPKRRIWGSDALHTILIWMVFFVYEANFL
jgi:hypothetical protein